MKLRIRGNSIRFRLTESEVAELAANGRVESSVCFGNEGEERLRYLVKATENDGSLTAEFRNNEITISIPETLVSEWASSERIGIEASQEVDDGQLKILIEKDFACLKPRAGNEDADAYANPLAAEKG